MKNQNVSQVVATMIAEHLAVEARAIDPRQLLEVELGLDILDLTLIAIRLEGELDVELPLDQLHHVRTVGDIILFVRRMQAEALESAPRRNESGERWRRRTSHRSGRANRSL